MKEFVVFILTVFITLSLCEPPSKKPLVYPNWPPKNIQKPSASLQQQPMRRLILQIRSNSGMPSTLVIKRGPPPGRQQMIVRPMMRPIKLSLSPQFLIKPSPLIGKRPIKQNINKMKFTSKPTHPGYSYEKPFSPAAENKKPLIENTIHLTHGNNHFGPIHTIPAPNLGTNSVFGQDHHDNHIHFDEQRFTPKPGQYNNHHQYQVTEDTTNDQTLRDPFSGQQKYFAPDPDPSLPAAKIRPSTDPLSRPSSGQSLPLDVQANYFSTPAKVLQQHLVQYVSPVPQQQLSDSYGLPITNQPQLQQYLLQQSSAVQGMPLSVHNPTYLVTQSNQLYNQHQQQQQLFKPDPGFLQSINPGTIYGDENLTQQVASNGQILQAAQDQANQIYPHYTGLHEPTSDDQPAFAALIGNIPEQNFLQNYVEAHPPSQQLVQDNPNNNDIQFQNIAGQGGFVASNYFGRFPSQQSYEEYIDSLQRQQDNDRTLEQSNYEMQIRNQQQHEEIEHQLQIQHQQLQHDIEYQQQIQHQQLQQEIEHQQQIHNLQQHQEVPNPQQIQNQGQTSEASNDQSASDAYHEHQRLLQEQFGSTPYGEYQTENTSTVRKRSDSNQSQSEESSEANIDGRSISVSTSLEVSSEDKQD